MKLAPPVPASRQAPFARARRGAILIVALLVAALIALVLGSYLNVNISSGRLAKRSFYGYAALNLAEAGAEEAVWAFNHVPTQGPAAWLGWTNNGTAAWQTLPNFSFAPGITGWAKVYVDSYSPSSSSFQPKVVVQSSVGGADDAPVTKYLEVKLRRRSYFANGLVAKNSIAFNGSAATVDAWNSDPDNDAATPGIPYSAAVRTDHGSIASMSVLNTAVLINQLNVWGTVATGGEPPQVGRNGSIRNASTPPDVTVDSNLITTDFNAYFPVVSPPVDGTPIASIGATLGTLGTATKWRTPGLTLRGSDTLTILGDVTLILTTGSGGQAITVTGTAKIVIPAGSSLTIYAEGDVSIRGNAISNANAQPVSCRIWGTNHSEAGQQIDIGGSSALSAVVYAPNGEVKIFGDTDVMGAVVARGITMMGSAQFHYDEALANTDGNEPFQIGKWRELTSPSDISYYKTLMDRL